MNPLQKLLQVLRNLIGPKVTKTQKITTINLERPKIISKISQTDTPDVQIKQVERKQQQKTITSFTEQLPEPLTEFSPTVIPVSVQHIDELKSGSLWDHCGILVR